MAYGFRYNKTPGRSTGMRTYSPKDMKRVGWCMKKGISIGVIPNWDGGTDEWKVELNINGKIHVDPKIYDGYDALGKMYEYYKYYYDKYRN